LKIIFFKMKITKVDFAGKVWSAHPRSTARQPATAVSHVGEWQNQHVDQMARSIATPAE
jgi:hypothetical protein